MFDQEKDDLLKNKPVQSALKFINDLEREIGASLIKGDKSGVINKDQTISLLKRIEGFKSLYSEKAFSHFPPWLSEYKSPYLKVIGEYHSSFDRQIEHPLHPVNNPNDLEHSEWIERVKKYPPSWELKHQQQP